MDLTPGSPGKQRGYSIDSSYMSGPGSIASPGGNGIKDRFAEKDSLYLDMGKPELNGKIGTLANGSHNDSLLLHNRGDSNASVTLKDGTHSSFAKGVQQPDQKTRSKSFRGHAGGANNQSFLKAAIFRNMQKNSDYTGEEIKEDLMDIKRKRRESDRPSIYNRLSSTQSPDQSPTNNNNKHSNSDIDSSNDICSENPQVQMNVERIKAETPDMRPSKHAHSNSPSKSPSRHSGSPVNRKW